MNKKRNGKRYLDGDRFVVRIRDPCIVVVFPKPRDCLIAAPCHFLQQIVHIEDPISRQIRQKRTKFQRKKNNIKNEYQVRNVKWSGSFSEGALCETSQSLWHTHNTQGPQHIIIASRARLCHNSLRLLYLDYPVPAVRNVTFANRILDGEYKVIHSFWNVKV